MRNFITQVYQGKTIRRIAFNSKLEDYCHEFKGVVLDLGGKSSEGLKRFLPKNVKLITTDLIGGDNVDAVDLNQRLPYDNDSMDIVTMFFVLYILENRERTLREIYRVLKPGGKLYLTSPFISAEIPEPHDYCRLTYEGLDKAFRETGFSNITIERMGGRATSAVAIMHPYFVFNTVRLLVFPFSIFLDKLTRSLDVRHPVPHTYFCIVTK